MPPARMSRSQGFTLVEILVALALVTGLTLMMFQAIAPWLNLRQKIETERRLEQVQSALELAYRVSAMGVDARTEARLDLTLGTTTISVTPSTQTGAAGSRSCNANANAANALATYVSDDTNRSFMDGSKQPMCLFITPRLSQSREGVTIFYHVAAIVGVGNDGVLGATTGLDNASGVLTIDPASDDIGVVMNGFNIQYELYQETRRRVDRAAEVYGSYFTARYLGNPSRDYSIDYFVSSNAATYYDSNAGGLALPTGSMWQPVSSHLAGLGLGPDERVSPYESSNAIEVANQQLDVAHVIGGVQVQEPATKSGLALPPYTALLRARLPGGSAATPNYLVRVVPGNY